MQFFPADIFGSAAGLSSKSLGSGFGVAGASGFGGTGGSSSFQDVFGSLAAFNENNTTGVPLTTRSTRDDRSFFKSDEYAHLKNKLVELGVSEKIAEEYFGYMSAAKGSPSIGQMRSSVHDLLGSRLTAGLDKQEFVQLSATLGKLGFSNDEIKDFERMMHQGDSLGMLKMIGEKVTTLAESGKTAEIGKEELDLIIKACDIHADYREPVLSAWQGFGLAEDAMLVLDGKAFNRLFGSTVASLEKRGLELAKLADCLDEAIESMLEYRAAKSNEPVADTRGNARTERAETMAKILATLLDEESEEPEENSTSHLMDGEKSGKSRNRESIAASFADNKMTPKAVREEREAEARAGIRGEAPGDEAAEPRASASSAGQAVAGRVINAGTADKPNAADPEANARPEAQAGRAAPETTPRETAPTGDGKPRQDLAGRQNRGGASGGEADTARAAFSAKVQEAPGVVLGVFGQTENSSASGQAARSAKTEIYHERIFEQIERGIVRNAGDGSRQIVLRLDPPELGKLTLSLTMAQGEVKALIRTESAAVTQAVSEQLAQLRQSLEEQGFKVSGLDVETRSQSHAGTDQWSGAEQHNQEREMLEQSRFLRLARSRAKEGATLAQSMQNVEQPASISASGLHIIA